MGQDGEEINITVQVKEQPSPRLVTVFPQHQRLVSTVLGYSQRSPDPEHFLATELTNQQFIAGSTQYLNQVETTTDYHHVGREKSAPVKLPPYTCPPRTPIISPLATNPLPYIAMNLP
ncbi:hypothetical protein NON20_10660 [Synechocystis sp. B12]|nr:hypothetical protein NON20_10660 [Synechocystis sp. B12]